jgi:hypothetical protein
VRRVPRLTGEVEVGDDVLVNEQARLLELGSGGFDVLYANLTRGLGCSRRTGAHVMALPYTPGQVQSVDKEESDALAEELDGLPVVLCTLHSQVTPVCAALGECAWRTCRSQVARCRSRSRTPVRTLKERGLVEVACAVAPCLDGDVQFVTVAAALPGQEARATTRWSARSAQASSAPARGSVTARSRSRRRQCHDAALGGRPVLAVPHLGRRSRASAHRGVSHHVQAVSTSVSARSCSRPTRTAKAGRKPA